MGKHTRYAEDFKNQMKSIVDNKIRPVLEDAAIELYNQKENEIEDVIDSLQEQPKREIRAKEVFINMQD